MIPFLSFAKNCFRSPYQQKDATSKTNSCNDRPGLYIAGTKHRSQVTSVGHHSVYK